MNRTRRNIVLFLLVILFSAPGISAYVLYFHPQWIPSTTTNRGSFITPPILLPDLGDDSKWRLVLWSPEACDMACMRQLDKLARVRLALGRRLYDVNATLLLSSDSLPMPEILKKMLHEQGMESRRLSADESARLRTLRPTSELFIANPDDYLVLAYSLAADADDLFHDIKQLTTKG